MIGKAVASKVPVDVAKSLPLIDEWLWETRGSRDGAHGIANAKGSDSKTGQCF